MKLPGLGHRQHPFAVVPILGQGALDAGAFLQNGLPVYTAHHYIGRNAEAILHVIGPGPDAQCVAGLQQSGRFLQGGAVGSYYVGGSGLRHSDRSRARRRDIPASPSTRTGHQQGNRDCEAQPKICTHVRSIY